jgi:hypothetical protein
MRSDDQISSLETGQADHKAAPDRLRLLRGVLGDSNTWSGPPAGLYEEIVLGLDGRPATGTDRKRRSLQPSLGIAAALLIALVGLLLTSSEGVPEETGMVIAVAGTGLAPEAAGTLLLRETPSGWYLRLDVSGLPPAPNGSYYEGWLSRDANAVSVGTFHMRNGAEPVALWSGVAPAEYPVFSVTLQDEGGGPAASDAVMLGAAVDG